MNHSLLIKSFLLYIFLATFLNSAPLKLLSVGIEADFTLNNVKGKTSKISRFSYTYMVIFKDKFVDNKRMHCFYSKKLKKINKKSKKPTHRICLIKNENKFIYYVNKNNRYAKMKNYKVNIKNMNLEVTNIRTKRKCENSGFNFKDFNQKIFSCFQKV